MLLTSLILFGGSFATAMSLAKHRSPPKKLKTLSPLNRKNRTGVMLKPVSTTQKHQNDKVVKVEQEINHYLAVSGTALALTTIGALIYPPLTLLSIPFLMYTSSYIFKNAYITTLRKRKVSAVLVDSIVIIGLIITGYYFATALLHSFYYYSRKLLLKTEDHSLSQLVNILGEQPRSVWIITNGVELEIPFEQLKVGDTIKIIAGETIPVDGLIEIGMANIDQQALTGELQPIEKGVGDQVLAGTVVLEGQIQVQVEKTGQATVAAQIGQILNNTTDFKASIQSYGERIIDQGALPTLVMSFFTLPILGVNSALALLNAGFGYHMRITGPLSMLHFLTMTSKNGVLVKDGRSLELLSQVDTVVFDKTGTLTEEQPHVGNLYCYDITENELLTYAATAEYKQTHPIAQAIIAEAKQRQLNIGTVSHAKYEVGYGLTVTIANQQIRVGSRRFMDLEQIVLPEEVDSLQERVHEQGHSLVFVALNDRLVGAIELYPTVRPEAKSVITRLKQRGLSVFIISGDQEQPTRQLAQELGITDYFAETLPQDKAYLIEQLQQQGQTVCFVGDGINDSIALKQAQVSISLRGATTVATDTAAIVLMDSHLNQLNPLFEIADKFNTNMKNNFRLSVIPGFICLGGVWFFHFGIVTTILLYDASLVLGIWNAKSPKIERSECN